MRRRIKFSNWFAYFLHNYKTFTRFFFKFFVNASFYFRNKSLFSISSNDVILSNFLRFRILMSFVKLIDFYHRLFTLFVEVEHEIFAYVNRKCWNFNASLYRDCNISHKFVYFLFISQMVSKHSIVTILNRIKKKLDKTNKIFSVKFCYSSLLFDALIKSRNEWHRDA